MLFFVSLECWMNEVLLYYYLLNVYATNCAAHFQLHGKFDKLKKEHTGEKQKLEDCRKKLEDEIIEFNRRKQQILTQNTSHHTLTLGKSKKKWNAITDVLFPKKSD